MQEPDHTVSYPSCHSRSLLNDSPGVTHDSSRNWCAYPKSLYTPIVRTLGQWAIKIEKYTRQFVSFHPSLPSSPSHNTSRTASRRSPHRSNPPLPHRETGHYPGSAVTRFIFERSNIPVSETLASCSAVTAAAGGVLAPGKDRTVCKLDRKCPVLVGR